MLRKSTRAWLKSLTTKNTSIHLSLQTVVSPWHIIIINSKMWSFKTTGRLELRLNQKCINHPLLRHFYSLMGKSTTTPKKMPTLTSQSLTKLKKESPSEPSKKSGTSSVHLSWKISSLTVSSRSIKTCSLARASSTSSSLVR